MPAKLLHAHPNTCDIADPAQVDTLEVHVGTQHPDIDVLFLNAGIAHTYQGFSDVDAVAQAAQEVDVNFVSAVRLTHAFEPLLRDQTDPAIIFATSAAALVPDTGTPRTAPPRPRRTFCARACASFWAGRVHPPRCSR